MNRKTPEPAAIPDASKPQPNPEARRARVYEPGWKYVPQESTDLAKTFARIRKQMKEAEAAKKLPHIPAATPIKRRA